MGSGWGQGSEMVQTRDASYFRLFCLTINNMPCAMQTDHGVRDGGVTLIGDQLE